MALDVRTLLAHAAGFALMTFTSLPQASAAGVFKATVVPPFKKLALDLTSQEYQDLLGARAFVRSGDEFDTIMAVGKRNLEWLEFVNAERTEDTKLQLSTAATQRGYPIDQATRSNRAIVIASWNDGLAQLPEVMKHVLVDGADFVRDLPISDDDYLANVRAVDRIYQSASRWLLQEPYLDYYAFFSTDDVRGYYFLKNTENLEATLKGWKTLAGDRQAQLKGWLIGECINREFDNATCQAAFDRVLARDGQPWSFHQDYVDAAAAHWDWYFHIPRSRSDVTWTAAQPGLFSVPFRDPGRAAVKNWLRTNIQDEWRWQDGSTPWQLVLAFQPGGSDDEVTHVNFVDGATPHVNGIAGNEITMDGNRNISEYTSRWTIRHEYGHVLGFPDCYIEFYDADAGEMISYQLDITNLMCSRRGHFQQQHFDELKRVYWHN